MHYTCRAKTNVIIINSAQYCSKTRTLPFFARNALVKREEVQIHRVVGSCASAIARSLLLLRNIRWSNNIHRSYCSQSNTVYLPRHRARFPLLALYTMMRRLIAAVQLLPIKSKTTAAAQRRRQRRRRARSYGNNERGGATAATAPSSPPLLVYVLRTVVAALAICAAGRTAVAAAAAAGTTVTPPAVVAAAVAVAATRRTTGWIAARPRSSSRRAVDNRRSIVRYQHHQHRPRPLFAKKRRRPDTNIDPSGNRKKKDDEGFGDDGGDDDDDSDNGVGDGGQVGSGRNWIERSFPVSLVDKEAKIDPNAVDDYNLGICGESFGTAALSGRMYDAIVSRTSVRVQDPQIQRAWKLCAMDFTAKEAARAALKQHGLEMSPLGEDIGMWYDRDGGIDAVRIYNNSGNDGEQELDPEYYDSWEDCIDRGKWQPGRRFDFVVRQVPAKMRKLDLDELLQALDPDGSLRRQAKESGVNMPDEIDVRYASLQGLANENVRRTEAAPRGPSGDVNGTELDELLEKRGYRPIKASSLSASSSSLEEEVDADEERRRTTLMHVMDALVSHGCLLVDLLEDADVDVDATSHGRLRTMAKMWDAVEEFFKDAATKSDSQIPPLATIPEAGSRHAKVGFVSYDSGDMQFLETRWKRSTSTSTVVSDLLLPDCLSAEQCRAMKDAFDTIATLSKSVVEIAVAASTDEAGAAGDLDAAFRASRLLANELVDDGKPLTYRRQPDFEGEESTVSMSPHRLCRYSNNNCNDSSDASSRQQQREVFGAHTDSTFLTVVPVAAIPGLEVYDEDTEQWYCPEKTARRHWEKHRQQKQDASKEDSSIPWHARYLVVMPGELLQVATRNEVSAAVHRVMAAKDRPRLSAPVLFRGRNALRFDAQRYLCGTLGNPLLEECDGMTMEDIHDAMQPTSFQ